MRHMLSSSKNLIVIRFAMNPTKRKEIYIMANQNININPQDLIPEYWYGIYVPTEADLIFIGSKNLEGLKQYWQSEECSLFKQVKTTQTHIDLLFGKTPEDIKAIAAEYENPDFPKVSVLPDAWDDDPEPLDAASINRKSGATTFNVCGWCNHCSGGTCRYNYHITTFCPLIPRQLGNGETWDNNPKFRFNTPCALANGTQELLDTCVEYLKACKATLVSKMQRAAAYVGYLAEVMKKAEEKPYFADCRPYDWFNIGDSVKFLVSTFDNILPGKANTFISGKVINGYRHHDGCVSVCADEPFHTGEYCDGCGSGFGASRPEILLDWEFTYLKEHPDYLKVWLRCAKVEARKFDSKRFTKALMKA